jgi:hypothetical protein
MARVGILVAVLRGGAMVNVSVSVDVDSLVYDGVMVGGTGVSDGATVEEGSPIFTVTDLQARLIKIIRHNPPRVMIFFVFAAIRDSFPFL